MDCGSIPSGTSFPGPRAIGISSILNVFVNGNVNDGNSIGGISCARCGSNICMNCHCCRAGGIPMSFPFNCNVDCAAFGCNGPIMAGSTRNGVGILIAIGGTNGMTNGRIIRMCITTPNGSVSGPAERLHNFTGAGGLRPNRSRAIAVSVPCGGLTSFGRISDR